MTHGRLITVLPAVVLFSLANANAAEVSGKAVYDSKCAACHATGAANAPKPGDKAAWAPRLKAGTAALVQSVIKGKGAMPPRAGMNVTDAEAKAAVDYMISTVK